MAEDENKGQKRMKNEDMPEDESCIAAGWEKLEHYQKLASGHARSCDAYMIRFEPRCVKDRIHFCVVGRLRRKGAGSTSTVGFNGNDQFKFVARLTAAMDECENDLKQRL